MILAWLAWYLCVVILLLILVRNMRDEVCIKPGSYGGTWQDAGDKCVARGGQLLKLTSPEDEEYLTESLTMWDIQI